MAHQAKLPPLPSTPKEEFDKTYTFRLRRHQGGSFGGLWEMVLLTPAGKVLKEITDADALPYCLENLQGELENDGF
jgi:hypothetical protein